MNEYESVRCQVCDQVFDPSLVVEFQGRAMCGGCKSRTVSHLEFGQDVSDLTGDRQLPPWERREQLGFMAGLLETVKPVMMSPGEFFRGMDRSATNYQCLGFIMLITTATALMGWMVQMAMMMVLGAAGSAASGDISAMLAPAGLTGIGGILIVVLAPLIAILHAFVTSGIIHLTLMMMRRVGAPFHQTMRAYCYAQGPMLVGLIPFVGGSIGALWALLATVFMVMGVHRTSGGVAAVAVFLLPMLCCFAVLGLVVVGVMAGTMSGSM